MDPYDRSLATCVLGCRFPFTADAIAAHMRVCQAPALSEAMQVAELKRGSRRWLPNPG